MPLNKAKFLELCAQKYTYKYILKGLLCYIEYGFLILSNIHLRYADNKLLLTNSTNEINIIKIPFKKTPFLTSDKNSISTMNYIYIYIYTICATSATWWWWYILYLLVPIVESLKYSNQKLHTKNED